MRLAPLIVSSALLLIAFTPNASAQDAEWLYAAADGTGDVYPHAQLTFYDIASLKSKMGPEGEMIWELKVVDMERVTGNPRYCINFKVDGIAYQTGARFDAVAGTQTGAVTAYSRCNWVDQGASVGTPVLSVAGDSITVTIKPEDIPELADGGGVVSNILAKIGHSIPQYGGDDEFYDTLTPPADNAGFVFGTAGGGLENLTIAAPSKVEVPAGTEAVFTVNVTNLGQALAEFNMTVEGLPEGFDGSFDQLSANATAGNSTIVTLTVKVPMDASPGDFAFTISARGVNGGNATANTTLAVVAPEPTVVEGGPGQTTSASNETGAPASVTPGEGSPGFATLAALLALAAIVVARRRK